MKIGLIDVDGHNFPNLAVMKISAYHKAKGDSVEWVLPMSRYDMVYQSKVFTFTPDFDTCINAETIICGGTGYDLQNKLPSEIENMCPDYSLYNEKKAYGFLTRGCPRGCEFCIVGKKEGLKSYQVADLKQFWKGQKEIVLCDPNILACTDRMKLLQQLVDSKVWIDINQGLDIRFMTDEVINMIQQMKIRMIHFAWDNMKDSDLIVKNLANFKSKTDIDFRRLRVYVLVNFNTTLEEDLYRIFRINELGFDPFIMIFDKAHATKKIKRIARMINNKYIWRSGTITNEKELLQSVGA